MEPRWEDHADIARHGGGATGYYLFFNCVNDFVVHKVKKCNKVKCFRSSKESLMHCALVDEQPVYTSLQKNLSTDKNFNVVT